MIPNFSTEKFAPKGFRDKIQRGFCRLWKVIPDFSSAPFSAGKIWDDPAKLDPVLPVPSPRRGTGQGKSSTDLSTRPLASLKADFSVEKSGMTIPKYNVLGVGVSVLNLDIAARAVSDMIAGHEQGYVCVAPVSTVVDAHRSEAYRSIVNSAALVTPDGMPVVWLGQRQGHKEVQRTYGPDLMLKLCDVGQKPHWRHFFYGGTDEICDKLVKRLKIQFPDMVVAGTFAPPYVTQAEQVAPQIVKMINASRADILWVGLGSPKQDHWLSIHRPLLDVPVMIGIGAAFDFLAGVKPQAPRWLQRSGLEWLFRLSCEPRRLWKRYLVGNALFVWWLLTDTLFQRTHDTRHTTHESR
jgi:N-acetylglucosaminyldiphosphoundecaprenol N-acetyl-beta-D-mannosaminyltransferase